MISEDLLKKCINKDLSAWNYFIKSYTSLIRKSVTYKLKSLGVTPYKDRINEITQEILISIWEKDKLTKIKNIKAFKSWLVIVTLNMTINYCKKHFFRPNKVLVSLEKQIENDTPITLKDILPSFNINPLDAFDQRECRNLIEKEINAFPTKQQLAIKLNLFEYKKYREISEIMRIPEGTVATLISRAKKVLGEKLSNRGYT